MKKNKSYKWRLIIVLLVIGAIAAASYVVMKNNKNTTVAKKPAPQEQAQKPVQAAQTTQQQPQNKQGASQQEKNKELDDTYNKGYNDFYNHNYGESIQLEDKVITEDPTYYEAYTVKGIALCYSGHFDEGMKSIDKCLQLKSDYGYGRFNKALAYELYGYYDTAIAWYQKALEIENYKWSYYGISSIYGRRGDVPNTIKYLKQAIALDSSIKETAQNEKDFDPVKNSSEFKALVSN